MEKTAEKEPWFRLASQSMPVLLLLYFVSLFNFALFHILIELLNIVVAFGIFIVAWNSRDFHGNDFLMWIGIAFLFVGCIDLLQLISQPEFSILKEYGANLPQQLRTAGRYLESLSLLIALGAAGRKIATRSVFLGYLVIFLLILFSIFYWNIFPTTFNFGSGPTLFKTVSDYVIVAIFLVSLVILVKKRDKVNYEFANFLLLAIIFEIFCVLILTPYTGVYSGANMLGHSSRFIAFFFLYKAVIESGLMKPYALLLKDLIKKEQLLQESETKYRSVADNTHDWEFWINPRHEFVYISPSSRKITGHAPEEFLSDAGLLKKIIYPGDRPLFEKHRDEIEYGKHAGSLEFRVVLPDGSIRWIGHVCQPVFDGDNNFLGIRGSNRDISKRKQTEEKLEQARNWLEKRVKSRTAELGAANSKLKKERDQLIESYKQMGITNRKIALLLELNKIPASKKNKNEIVNYVLTVAVNFSQADGGFLYSYDSDNNIFKPMLILNDKHGKIKSEYISAGSGSFWQKLFRRKHRVFGSFDENQPECLNNGSKFKNFLLLPLLKDGELKGFIFLVFVGEKSMIELDLDFYEIFSLHAAQTLDASGVFAK